MSELREVPQATPIIDAVDGPGRRGLIAGAMRLGKRLFQRIRERRIQRKIDRRWHDVHVGKPERDEP